MARVYMSDAFCSSPDGYHCFAPVMCKLGELAPDGFRWLVLLGGGLLFTLRILKQNKI